MTASLPIRFWNLLVEHNTRYPLLQVQDVYKLLYQAAMGSGHAVPDAVRARIWLETEMQDLRPDANQPLFEPISPETRRELGVIRVHLRPYLAATSNIEPLLQAFVLTANEFVGSTRRLERYASLVCQNPGQFDLHFSIKEFGNFMDEMREQGYPSMHHSESYSLHYQPAYRVVAQKFLKPILDLTMPDQGI